MGTAAGWLKAHYTSDPVLGNSLHMERKTSPYATGVKAKATVGWNGAQHGVVHYRRRDY